jgi:hypothetical protein
MYVLPPLPIIVLERTLAGVGSGGSIIAKLVVTPPSSPLIVVPAVSTKSFFKF